MTTFLSNRDIYTSVVCGIVPQARDDPRSNFRYGVRHYDQKGLLNNARRI